jgi:iron complex outermembrane recepter protein
MICLILKLKKGLFLTCTILTTINIPTGILLAQKQVQGQVTESDGEPLAYANVLLLNAADSSFIKAEMTAEDGSFHFFQVSSGVYLCEISMIGFSSAQTRMFELDNNSDGINLGKTTLESTTDLEEVEIVARKALIEVRPDMMVFNVSASPGASGINGLDLMRKAPGVTVDMDDNILLLGKSDVQIHINGRPTLLRGNDLATLLQNISSDNVEAIEIITNPSSRYDAEGNAGIINIRLKKNPYTGLNGSINSSFTQGIYLRYNNGLTLNYGGERIRTTFELNRSDETSKDVFIERRRQNEYVLDLFSNEIRRRSGYNIGMGLDADLAKGHLLAFTGRATFNQNDNSLKSTTGITFPGSMLVNELLVSQTLLDRTFNNLNFNLNYQWKIDPTANFNTDLSYGKFTTLGFTDQPNTFFTPDGMSIINISNNEFNADTHIDMWSAKIDYDKSRGRITFSTGAKFTFISTDNKFEFFNIGPNGPVLNVSRSNDFLYTEQVLAGYAILDIRIDEFFKMSTGLRVENTASRGRLTSVQNIDNTDVPRNYTDFFPNIGLSYNDNRVHSLSLSVGRRLTRPNYQNLNPFESPISEISAWKGNPFLRPHYIMNYQAVYSLLQKLTITGQYSVTKDMFATIFEISGENSNILIPYNMDRSTQLSVAVSYPQEVTNFWEFVTFLDGGRITFNGNLEGTEIDLVQNTWNIRIQNNLKLPWGILLDLSYQRGSDWIWRGSVRVRGNQSLDFGIRKDFFDKRLQVRLTGADIFNTTNQYFYNGDYGGLLIDGIRVFDTQRFGVGATWKFGNQQVKSAKRSKGAMEEEMRRLNNAD